MEELSEYRLKFGARGKIGTRGGVTKPRWESMETASHNGKIKGLEAIEKGGTESRGKEISK